MITKKEESVRFKEKKRQLIIEAALKIFSMEGYHKARMESIAELAGIGKGTIYEYFPSKMELFKATVENSFCVYYQMFVTESQLDNRSLETMLYELFSCHIGFCQKHWDLANILFKEQHSLGEEFESWMQEMHVEQRKKVGAIIQSAIESKQIRPVDINVLSQVIMGIMVGLAFSVVVQRETADIEEVCRKAQDMLMNGIVLR